MARECESFFSESLECTGNNTTSGKGKQLKKLTDTCCSSKNVHSDMVFGQRIMKLRLMYFKSGRKTGKYVTCKVTEGFVEILLKTQVRLNDIG